jgi:hypothetical protein
MSKLLKFIEKSSKIHNNKYDYTSVIYEKAREKVKIICKTHGIFLQTPDNHSRGYGCPKCKGAKNSQRCRKTKEQFIKEASSIHNNFYNYDKINYTSTDNKIVITCPTHGDFEQTPDNHISGHGCPKCSSDNKTKTKEQFIKEASTIHNNFYNYDKTIYINAATKIIITCPIHGDFEQPPGTHLLGIGCSKCYGNNRKTTTEYIEQAKKIHGDKYDYTLVEYINTRTKINIICKKHGVFQQRADLHLTGSNCPNCLQSKKENLWLDTIGIPKNMRQIELVLSDKSIIKVDGFNPETNTIYEFYGDYWHGNPSKFNPSDINSNNKKTFGELYTSTLIRENKLLSDGFNLITIWECDFIP